MSKDWRETLFVWDGILSIVEKEDGANAKPEADGADSEGIELNWTGTWVGCDYADATKVGTPKRGAFDEFVSSEHAFEVTGTAFEGTNNDGEKGDNDDAVVGDSEATLNYRVAMIGGDGYDLGDGEEKKRHKDDTHDMYFSTLRWTGNLRDQAKNLVFALGENEFGHYISVGWLRVGNRVTLARRYVDENDERAKWKLHDLRNAVFDQISVTNNGKTEIRIPPWQCSAMNA